MSLIILFSSFTQFLPETDLYDLILNEAIHNCKNKSAKDIDTEILKTLISVEKEYELPDKVKGLLLSSACCESGYNPNAQGDHKFSKNKKKPKAVGLFQMWPWWENKKYGYGIDRTSPEDSARAYISHIHKQIEKVKKKCFFKTEEKIWISAWVHAIRKPKKEGRCYEKPLHLSVLKRWHKNINKTLKEKRFGKLVYWIRSKNKI